MLIGLGPRLLNLWAAYFDLEPPAHVAAESLMIRHAGALISAQSGSSEHVQDLLRPRESLVERKADKPRALDTKLVALARKGARGGKGG